MTGIDPNKVVHDGFTFGEISAAFDEVVEGKGRVEGPKMLHWKLPIRILVGENDTELFRAAIIFYTGGVPSMYRMSDGRTQLLAPGYYASCGS